MHLILISLYSAIFQEYYKAKNVGEIPLDEFQKDIQEVCIAIVMMKF